MNSKQYIKKRNNLIPEAEAYADSKVGNRPETTAEMEAWSAKWNHHFSRRMNNLSRVFVLDDTIKTMTKEINDKMVELHSKETELRSIKTRLKGE